jgi:uncharacterized protein (TIGR02147 family)
MQLKNTVEGEISVYRYTDFRLFIRDRYRFLKSLDRSMSYEKIGKLIGFSSPGFFTQIIQGKSRLPLPMVEKISCALKLNKKEAKYFALLVEYGQTEEHVKKHDLFKKVFNKNTGIAKMLSAEQYVMFDKWYYAAIHELLFYFRFNGDYSALAKKMQPQIAPSEARAAIELLVRLDLIRKDQDGFYVRSDAEHLTTGFHPESVAINNYLLEMMKLAQQSVETCTPETRLLSTLTVSLSENGFRRLAQDMHEFRRRLMSLAKEDGAEDRLYQINLQMFPLTKIDRKSGGQAPANTPLDVNLPFAPSSPVLDGGIL